MIPFVDETLRVNGHAEINAAPEFCDQFGVKDRRPKTVIRIIADEIFTHCGKAPLRAGLWRPESWPKSRPVPSLYEMVKDHSDMDVVSTDQSYAEERYRDTLY